MQRFFTCLILVAAFVLAGRFPCSAEERLSYYGFSPAYPTDFPRNITDAKFPFTARLKTCAIKFTIDGKGKVKQVASLDPADSLFLRPVKERLMAARFEPALWKGKATESSLLISMDIIPDRREPVFTIPLETGKKLVDRDLLYRSVEMNRVSFPRLVSFPSFWSNLKDKDSLPNQLYILLAIDLAASGEIEAANVVRATNEAFASQLIAATTRAKFEPAKVKNAAAASHFYLCIQFFPGNNYPTKPFTAGGISDLPVRERQQLLVLHDTLGMMVGPIPRFSPGESLTGISAVANGTGQDTLSVTLSVSVAGKSGAQRYDATAQDLDEWIRTKSAWMRFYPAIDFHGEPLPFRGNVQFILRDSTSVRILYPWLQ